MAGKASKPAPKPKAVPKSGQPVKKPGVPAKGPKLPFPGAKPLPKPKGK